MKMKLLVFLSLLTLTLAPADAAVRYVNLANTIPAPPYTNWASAATNIQDAIDGANAGDEIVVTNGMYATGGRVMDGSALTNRVVVDKAVTVRSVNGPEATVIRGYQVPGITNGDGAVRCVWLASDAALMGFTLTNGATLTAAVICFPSCWAGGGVWCDGGTAVVSNCVLTGNSADFGGGAYQGTLYACTLVGNSALGSSGGLSGLGGGACNSSLNNCRLVGNSASQGGGGAALGTLNNCLLTGNSAGEGGGAYRLSGSGPVTLHNCTITGNSATRGGGVAGFPGGGFIPRRPAFLANCIVYGNHAPDGANYSACNLTYSCTAPLPDGVGNIHADPRFVDLVEGDLRLRSCSPCINAGRNADAPVGQDLDDNPRIVGGTLDIGAYEFQNPASTLSYAWLKQFGLPTDASADFEDPDGDHFTNYQEWRAGTDPTNGLSVLRLLTPSFDGINWLVSWQSVLERNYTLERSVSLSGLNGFVPVATTVPGQSGTTSVVDTNATAMGPTIYRVRVEE